jgi:hypothetical protein
MFRERQRERDETPHRHQTTKPPSPTTVSETGGEGRGNGEKVCVCEREGGGGARRTCTWRRPAPRTPFAAMRGNCMYVTPPTEGAHTLSSAAPVRLVRRATGRSAVATRGVRCAAVTVQKTGRPLVRAQAGWMDAPGPLYFKNPFSCLYCIMHTIVPSFPASPAHAK